MRRQYMMLFLALTVLLVTTPVFAQEDENRASLDYTLWLGAHYSDYSDYSVRVGRYEYGESRAFPELRFNLNARKKDASVLISSHYYDPKNIFARIGVKASNRIALDIDYVSLIRRDGQDQLANLEAREWLGTSPGGKMTTHELTDLGVDYAKDRHEIRSRLKVLLSKRAR